MTSSLYRRSSAAVSGHERRKTMEEFINERNETDDRGHDQREPARSSNVGDTVRVAVRIKEGEQASAFRPFEGTVIAKRHGGIAGDLHRPPFLLRRRRRACVPRELPVRGEGGGGAHAARCAVRSCSTCAAARARPPRSRLASDYRPICSKKGRTVGVLPFLFYQFLCQARGA